jgi:uncharacterized protein with FMN-binding domain
MRRITTWLLSTLSALVLLFSYHTSTSSTAAGVVAAGDANSGTATGSTGSSSGSPSGAAAGSGSAGTSEPAPSTPSSSTTSDGTYTGDAVMTRYGAVQVEITVSNGQITSSTVTQVPWSNGRDQQINGYAVPILDDEVVRAQGSGIDMVSGATYTSEGYVQSLQSAIDRANL